MYAHKYSSYLVRLAEEAETGDIIQKNLQEPEQPCSLEAFFEKEKAKPEHLRSRSAMLVCFCPKCRRIRGTL